MREPGRELVENAGQNGDRPSLAREEGSEVDRRKREELEQTRRFQEDEELYEEKERNQKITAKFRIARFRCSRKHRRPIEVERKKRWRRRPQSMH